MGPEKTHGPLPTMARKCYSSYPEEGRNVPYGPNSGEPTVNTDQPGEECLTGDGVTLNVVL
jgi:hypothetical protein